MRLEASDQAPFVLVPQEEPMRAYKPGQGVRTTVQAFLAGVLTDPSSATVTVDLPGGGQLSPGIVQDTTGVWHADFTIPFTTTDGIGAYRWQSTGTADADNGVTEVRFRVLPLDF